MGRKKGLYELLVGHGSGFLLIGFVLSKKYSKDGISSRHQNLYAHQWVLFIPFGEYFALNN